MRPLVPLLALLALLVLLLVHRLKWGIVAWVVGTAAASAVAWLAR